MLFTVLERMIQRGQTSGLPAKLDVLYAAGRLKNDEYTALIKLLAESEKGDQRG